MGPKSTFGINEINFTQVDHQGQFDPRSLLVDELGELLVGVGVELTCEAEHQALALTLTTAPQGNSQSVQVGDWSGSRRRISAQFSWGWGEGNALARISPQFVRSALLPPFGHQRREPKEVVVCIMGAGTGLRVVLHTKHGLVAKGEGGHGVVVEVVVGDPHPLGR